MNEFDNKPALCTVILCAILFWASLFSGKGGDYSKMVFGSSMNPTLEELDLIKVERTNDLRRGDIVTYRPPISIYKGSKVPDLLLGRIVGVGSELVEIQEGQLLVNERKVVEPHVNIIREFTFSPPQSVPPDYFFIMQDTGSGSWGSHILGPVSRSNIVGKVSKVYKRSKLDRMAVIESLTGAMVLVLFFVIPIGLYARVASIKIVKWVVLLQIGICGLVLLLMGYAMVFPEQVYKLWILPFAVFHNIEHIFKFILLGSELAGFLTILLTWVGGIVAVLQLWKIYRRSRAVRRIRST